jgi:hypothetical protein
MQFALLGFHFGGAAEAVEATAEDSFHRQVKLKKAAH